MTLQTIINSIFKFLYDRPLIIVSAIIVVLIVVWLLTPKGTSTKNMERFDVMRFTPTTHKLKEAPGVFFTPGVNSEGDSKGEKECRRILEVHYNLPFPKVRPDFLRNPVTGQNLEIDCFNKQLGLGVEFSGRQHFEFIPYFHTSRKYFQKQLQRDETKARLCRENGVKLIVVPWNVKNIEEFLKPHLPTFSID